VPAPLQVSATVLPVQLPQTGAQRLGERRQVKPAAGSTKAQNVCARFTFTVPAVVVAVARASCVHEPQVTLPHAAFAVTIARKSIAAVKLAACACNRLQHHRSVETLYQTEHETAHDRTRIVAVAVTVGLDATDAAGTMTVAVKPIAGIIFTGRARVHAEAVANLHTA
jgi:hypothetical protein